MRVIAFLPIAVAIHFGLTFAVVVGRLECGVLAGCISPLNEVSGTILSFPLGLVVWVMQQVGLDPAVVTNAIWGGDILVMCLVNSSLAIVIVWYVFSRTLVGARMFAERRRWGRG